MNEDEVLSPQNAYLLGKATKRLKRDFALCIQDENSNIKVAILEENILEWHFALFGKENTSFENGIYHGKLKFPLNFPFGPPSIYMITPNGRFKTNHRLCFSLSDYHPESWKPSYTVSSILQGVYDFMHDSLETIGSIVSSNEEKSLLARQSMLHNLGNDSFNLLFPNIVNEFKLSKANINFPPNKEFVSCQHENAINECSIGTDIISQLSDKIQPDIDYEIVPNSYLNEENEKENLIEIYSDIDSIEPNFELNLISLISGHFESENHKLISVKPLFQEDHLLQLDNNGLESNNAIKHIDDLPDFYNHKISHEIYSHLEISSPILTPLNKQIEEISSQNLYLISIGQNNAINHHDGSENFSCYSTNSNPHAREQDDLLSAIASQTSNQYTLDSVRQNEEIFNENYPSESSLYISSNVPVSKQFSDLTNVIDQGNLREIENKIVVNCNYNIISEHDLHHNDTNTNTRLLNLEEHAFIHKGDIIIHICEDINQSAIKSSKTNLKVILGVVALHLFWGTVVTFLL